MSLFLQLVIIGCLILQQRYKRIQERYLSLSKDVASDSGRILVGTFCPKLPDVFYFH